MTYQYLEDGDNNISYARGSDSSPDDGGPHILQSKYRYRNDPYLNELIQKQHIISLKVLARITTLNCISKNGKYYEERGVVETTTGSNRNNNRHDEANHNQELGHGQIVQDDSSGTDFSCELSTSKPSLSASDSNNQQQQEYRPRSNVGYKLCRPYEELYDTPDSSINLEYDSDSLTLDYSLHETTPQLPLGTFIRFPMFEPELNIYIPSRSRTRMSWKWYVGVIIDEMKQDCMSYKVLFAHRGKEQVVTLDQKSKGLLWNDISEQEIDSEIHLFNCELKKSNNMLLRALHELFQAPENKRLIPESTARHFHSVMPSLHHAAMSDSSSSPSLQAPLLDLSIDQSSPDSTNNRITEQRLSEDQVFAEGKNIEQSSPSSVFKCSPMLSEGLHSDLIGPIELVRLQNGEYFASRLKTTQCKKELDMFESFVPLESIHVSYQKSVLSTIEKKSCWADVFCRSSSNRNGTSPLKRGSNSSGMVDLADDGGQFSTTDKLDSNESQLLGDIPWMCLVEKALMSTLEIPVSLFLANNHSALETNGTQSQEHAQFLLSEIKKVMDLSIKMASQTDMAPHYTPSLHNILNASTLHEISFLLEKFVRRVNPELGRKPHRMLALLISDKEVKKQDPKIVESLDQSLQHNHCRNKMDAPNSTPIECQCSHQTLNGQTYHLLSQSADADEALLKTYQSLLSQIKGPRDKLSSQSFHKTACASSAFHQPIKPRFSMKIPLPEYSWREDSYASLSVNCNQIHGSQNMMMHDNSISSSQFMPDRQARNGRRSNMHAIATPSFGPRGYSKPSTSYSFTHPYPSNHPNHPYSSSPASFCLPQNYNRRVLNHQHETNNSDQPQRGKSQHQDIFFPPYRSQKKKRCKTTLEAIPALDELVVLFHAFIRCLHISCFKTKPNNPCFSTWTINTSSTPKV